MNTLKRQLFFVITSGLLAFGQTTRPAEPAAVPPAPSANLAGSVMLAANAPAESLVAASATHSLLVQPALIASRRKPEVSARERQVYYSLMIAEHGAAIVDAWSTRQVLSGGGRELDPLVRPFAHSATLYPALQVAPFVVDYFAGRLMRSNHAVLRKMWWVPQVVSMTGSAVCGATNLSQ